VNARTCKHLQGLLGHEYEAARLKFKNPDGPVPAAPKGKAKAKPASKAKASSPKKKAAGDDEEGEGGDEEEDADGADGGELKGAPDLLLANKWDLETGLDPTGWWISEKLDGVR